MVLVRKAERFLPYEEREKENEGEREGEEEEVEEEREGERDRQGGTLCIWEKPRAHTRRERLRERARAHGEGDR